MNVREVVKLKEKVEINLNVMVKPMVRFDLSVR
jgi:hypothetical protein